MKRIIVLMLGICLFFGCQKEDGNTSKASSDSLEGTIWVSNFGTTNYPELRAIEFTSATSVKSYPTDEYLTDNSGANGRKSGTYKRNGNKLTFNLQIFHIAGNYTCKDATISGERMIVTTTYRSSYSNSDVEETHSFLRKQ